jgi:hypothetical protein
MHTSGGRRGGMKAHQAKVDKSLHLKPLLKPLSIEQRNAIDLLIVGKSDQETAEAVGVTRQTIFAWRTSHLVFQSELEQARGALWRLSAERLRGMMSQALDNIAKAIDQGDVKSSFELLRAVGIHGDKEINSISDWRMQSLITQKARAQAKAEGFVEERDLAGTLLTELNIDHEWRHRVQEIEAELWDQYSDEIA